MTKPATPLVARHAEHEVPSHRRTGKAVGGRHDDVATFGGIQRPEHRQIVGRPAVTGHGDADQRSGTWRQWLDRMVQGSAPAHRVDDMANRHAGKGARRFLPAGRSKRRLMVSSGGSSIMWQPLALNERKTVRPEVAQALRPHQCHDPVDLLAVEFEHVPHAGLAGDREPP